MHTGSVLLAEDSPGEKRSFFVKYRVLSFILISLFSALIFALSFALFAVTAPSRGKSGEVLIEIPQGSGLHKIAALLEEGGAIRGQLRFTLLANLLGVARGLKYGEYQFKLPATPLALLKKMARGDVVAFLITFPEGSTIFDVAHNIDSAGLCPEQAILRKATEAQFASRLGIDGAGLEGYLFPETYKFNRGSSPEIILKRMVERFDRLFDRAMVMQAEKHGLSKKDVVIIASLVEKETAAPGEKPLVAAVFLNRLKKGMRLDCDPTVIYSLRLENPAFNERLTKTHLKKQSPYNTYVNYGLPPGPVCSPGIDSIRAVLNPAPVNYLYFVSKNDGTHFFSETLPEHNAAVNKYQR
jgi:UPF0755 protein